ncbi:hypothetical protein LOC68_03955 [Blastopirellula sp. JC732]|uniref:DUF11 domain-containing protein n=1 Tax=Blastopirellula sediminis TaxID=2894196 RepID=A0A9X1SFA3_9BACT|nr:hypothetical protein [Blastopirellula sediminis]MCC9609687.1 hypothetical protein [Blastopirellula sediminis]MCC9627537.1 hypothetical protein [Blastopirellula sediminis]
MRSFHPDNSKRLIAIGLLVSLLGSGCSSIRVPAIDPTGRRVFDCSQSTTLSTPSDCMPKPAYAVPPTPGPCTGSGVAVSTPLPKPPKGVVEPEKSLSLSPSRVVAPVGTEVVLVAGLNGEECCLHEGGRPIKWMLSQDSVGHFSEVGGRDTTTRFISLGGEQGIVSPTYAIGRTQLCDKTIDRGTEIPGDDVRVLRGQNWISVSSSSPGTSRVTALADKLENWPARQRTATVEWIDAQWQIPASAFQRAGERAFLTTVVTTQTTQSPLHSWIVKYEIIDGAAAGFMVNGAMSTAPAVEVTTDSAGRATAEIVPATRDQPGVARVRISVIRPDNANYGTTERLTLATQDATVTWSAAQLTAEIAGPAIAEIDSTATYDLIISNQGDVPATNVVAFIPLPGGMEYAQSSIPATQRGNDVEWSLGTIEARGYRRIQMVCAVRGAGNHQLCLSVSGDGELRHRSCANTQVASNNISVQVNGPQQITNGAEFDTIITIRNNGTSPLTNLVLRDEFSAGLQHISGAGNMIATDPISLGPGQTINETLTFNALANGRQCHRVTVTADGEAPVLREACVDVIPPAAQPNYNLSFVATSPNSSGQQLQTMAQGDEVLFLMQLQNISSVPLRAVQIVINYDANFEGVSATQYGDSSQERTVKWQYNDGIAPGASAELRVLCKATELAGAACARVTVSTTDMQPQTKQACVQITPPRNTPVEQPPAVNPNGAGNNTPMAQPGRLTARIASLQGDVRVGEAITYVMSVKNESSTDDSNLQLTLRFSPSLKFQSIRPRGTGNIGMPRPGQDGSVIFPAINFVRGGETLEYEVQAVATAAGPQTIVIEATSARSSQLATSQETTNAYPQ